VSALVLQLERWTVASGTSLIRVGRRKSIGAFDEIRISAMHRKPQNRVRNAPVARGSSNKRVNAIMSRVPQLSNATLSSFLLTFRAEGFPEYKFYQ